MFILYLYYTLLPKTRSLFLELNLWIWQTLREIPIGFKELSDIDSKIAI